MAAEQGYVDAQFNLGGMYDSGTGVARDEAEAAKWYRMAAEQGHAKSQYRVGAMDARGEGVPKNDAIAYMWINIASLEDDAARQNRELLLELMTSEQVAEGERLLAECVVKSYKDCAR